MLRGCRPISLWTLTQSIYGALHRSSPVMGWCSGGNMAPRFQWKVLLSCLHPRGWTAEMAPGSCWGCKPSLCSSSCARAWADASSSARHQPSLLLQHSPPASSVPLWRLGWLCWPAMPLPLQSCSSPYKAAQSLLAITLVPTAPVQSWALEESSCLEGLEARELAWFAWVGLVHMGESSLGL